MQKHLLYINLFAISSALALAACSDEVENAVTPDMPEVGEKTPIELSVGGVDAPEPLTRAVITDGTGKTMNAFDQPAYIFMVMQSEYGTVDYLGTHDTKYNVTRGDVAKDQGVVTFTDNNKRYWDDAHARSSQLSIWAYAQKGQTWTTCSFQEITGTEPETSEAYKKEYQTGNTTVWSWQTKRIYPAIREWKTAYTSNYPNQTADDIIKQDLLFSNNLTYNQEKNWADNRLTFNFGTRKFPIDNVMKFYHAMSKITIQIKAGKGFKADGTDFKLKNNTVDLLRGFNTKGLFNIKDGEFQFIHESADITSIPLQKTEVGTVNPYYTLEALAVPNIHQFMVSKRTSEKPDLKDENSRFVDGSADVMMQITVDDNVYKITSDVLFDAITGKTNATTLDDNGTYVPLEAGKNYVFTFTIGKQQIENLSAQVAEWETVTADNITPSNARIKLQLEERGVAQNSDVAFYMAKDNKTTDGIDDDYAAYNWKTGYVNLNANYSTSHWTTDYFWESNKDFYHFRALMPDETEVTSDPSDPTNGDYATLTSAVNYTDIRWGAPMTDDGYNETAGTFKWTYDPTTYGFDNVGHTQIYKAIGPTEDPVKLILFHMMSDLKFTLSTTGDTDTDHIDFGDGSDADHYTKVELVDYKKQGQLLLGSGLIKATESSTVSMVSDVIKKGNLVCTFRAVPQNLAQDATEGSSDVKLRITTPDQNQYIVDLKDVVASSISTNNIENPYQKNTSNKYILNRWYPGFKYNYSFKLTKKGITDITATIVEWESITADDQVVTIR